MVQALQRAKLGSITCTALPYSVLLLLLWGIWRWSIAIDQAPLSLIGFQCGVQLMAAAAVLTLVGMALIRLAQRTIDTDTLEATSLSFSPLAKLLMALTLGQVAGLTWILFRSGVNAIAHALLGVRLPITLVEVCVILIGAGYIVTQKRVPRGGGTQGSRTASGILPFLLLLAAVCLPVVLREIPRDTTLSSDPDQHAFYARQVLRLGGIPWDQGIFGPEHFHYPGGFGALNALWSLFSGLSQVEIVTLQPMLQFVLMCTLCAAFAPLLLASRRKTQTVAPTNLSTLALALGLVVVYWFFLPYGYQHDMYHGEGTARASTTLLVSFVFLVWLGFPARVRSSRTTLMWLAVLMSTTTAIATFNPISAICPILLVSSISLYEIARSIFNALRGRVEGLPQGAIILALGLISFSLLCSDPYFGEKVLAPFAAAVPQEVASNVQPAAVSTEPYVKIPAGSLLEWFLPLQHVSFFFAGTVVLSAIPMEWHCILAGMMLIWVFVAPTTAIRYLALGPLISFCFVLALSVPPREIKDPPLYLFQPYLIRAVLQAGAVCAFCLLAVSIRVVTRERSLVRALIALGLTLRFTWYPAQSFASGNPIFIVKPRATHPGSLGGITEGDREAIAFIKTFGASVLSKYGDLSHDEAPKILIPSHPTDLGFEKWLFPIGASRLVPLESPLPVAFFYGQGSRLWSYDNYRQHVCLQFDKEWLKKRNIRYVFIPKSNPGCIRGKQALLAESKILFEKDETRVIQIF